MQHREAGGVVAPFQPRLRHLARGLQQMDGTVTDLEQAIGAAKRILKDRE